MSGIDDALTAAEARGEARGYRKAIAALRKEAVEFLGLGPNPFAQAASLLEAIAEEGK